MNTSNSIFQDMAAMSRFLRTLPSSVDYSIQPSRFDRVINKIKKWYNGQD